MALLLFFDGLGGCKMHCLREREVGSCDRRPGRLSAILLVAAMSMGVLAGCALVDADGPADEGLPAESPLADEIGRASCRERV